jgi:hypothetical protein
MNDIAKCDNKNCVKKTRCYRYIMKVPGHIHWYSFFSPENNTKENFKCEDLILKESKVNEI